MDRQFLVAVVGGACAGSEIAAQLQQLGMEVVVFEQNDLPYGKIEDGLPRWHAKLQAKEMAAIDSRLDQPGIHFVPRCRLGREIHLGQLREDWGFSLVVLATGAWRDRPLRVEGVDAIQDDSFVYQNPLVYWFNHYQERHFSGKSYHIPAGATIIGGGLASIDVAKICQFELVSRALRQRGLEADVVEMDHYGVDRVLADHDLSWEELAIEPAKLFYRKRIQDMPLMPMGDDPTPEKLLKAEAVREKLIQNNTRRYRFEVHPLHVPTRVDHVQGSVASVTFALQAYRDGRFIATSETRTVATPMLIGSIGSIPEPGTGIPMQGELYDTTNPFTGAVTNMEGVHCVGNAITGRGNIKESQKNARRLGGLIRTGLGGDDIDWEGLFASQREEARAYVEHLFGYVQSLPPLAAEVRQKVRTRVAELQAQRQFGSYSSWRDKILTERGVGG